MVSGIFSLYYIIRAQFYVKKMTIIIIARNIAVINGVTDVCVGTEYAMQTTGLAQGSSSTDF